MVVRSDTRRRKRDGSDAAGAAAASTAAADDSEKRTKVHAQRKFAHGSSQSSPALTPVKDKTKANGSLPEPIAEITPAKRPKTTDFLTFLCLRGSSFLPSRLNFFANPPAPTNQDAEPTVNGHGPSKTAMSKQEKASAEAAKKLKEAGKTAKKSAPAASSTVQALKKKYQEQRLTSKTRSGVLNKLAQKVKDKTLTRARAVVPVEKKPAPKKKLTPPKPVKVVKAKPVVKASPAKHVHKDRRSTRSSGVAVDSTPLVLPVPKRKKNNGRVGLRSGGKLPPTKDLPKIKRPKAAPLKEKPKPTKAPEPPNEDERPSPKKPKVVPVPAKVEKKLPAKTTIDKVAKKRLQLAKTAQQKKARLQTRSQAPIKEVKTKEPKKVKPPPKAAPQRLSRKTKEAATIYMELLGRKWMSPGEGDDEDDEDDAISLYSFPELHRQSADKASQPAVKKRKVDKDPQVDKEPPKESQEKSEKGSPKKLPPKEKEKPEEKQKPVKPPPKVDTVKPTVESPPKPAPKKSVEKEVPTPPAAPIARRKTSRASLAAESLKSDSEDESLDKKMKKAEEKRKQKKAEKQVEKPLPKPSLATIKKPVKPSVDTKVKAQSMSQLVRFTKKKFLNVRKSTEACIQELVASTMERLKMQEDDEFDLDEINEPIIDKRRDNLPGKRAVPKLGKDLVAKKTASFVPAPANSLYNGSKFYAKKTAAIYPPSPAQLKKMTKGLLTKASKKSAEQKAAQKFNVEKPKSASVPKPAEKSTGTPVHIAAKTQTQGISAQNFVMINSSAQDLLLIPSSTAPNSGSASKFIVCRKEAIMTPSGGVQYMVVPTDKVVVPVAPVASIQPQQKQQMQLEAKKHSAKNSEQPVPEPEPKKTKATSSTQISAAAQAAKKPSPDKGEKKAIFQRVRERVEKVKSAPKSVNAFCPENESSVYAFDTDPEDTPASPPFRRKKDEPSPTSPHKHSSIAVQVDFEEPTAAPPAAVKTTPKSSKATAAKKPDSSAEKSFFIPIQPDVSLNQQIQGVEVKVGTEGVMQAKLVTNSQGKFAAPLNASGLVRSSQHPAAVGKGSPKTVPTKSVLGPLKTTPKQIVAPSPAAATRSAPTTPKTTPQTTPKAQQAPRRPSMDSTPSPSTSTKSGSKRQPPLQRQSSLTAIAKDVKATRLFESQCTPNKFPTPGGSKGALYEAPVFHPTEKEFQDPLEYIEKISAQAEQFGICRIVPPSTFKPECKVSDDMRFMAYNQYVHKMVSRWGPNAKETAAIKKLLKKQNINYTHPPWIGGMEIDLSKFSQTVQSLGGLKGVIEKKRWNKVADAMKIPKSAQDRVTKLDDIYCQFLLAYDTLSHSEKKELLDEVQAEWDKRQVDFSSDDEDSFDETEECVTKGRNMPLSAFYRIARNTMSMWFKTPEPAAYDVEAEYWRVTRERTCHVCVHSGSIDSGVWGYGFPTNKNSPCAKHPWNLKVLSNNSSTILRSMGSVMGVTVPTLHLGMLFSTFCWYRDPHGLPWIEYLHTGANKIWYGIPNSHSASFKNAMRSIVPKYCRDRNIWLPSDTAMVPPDQLISHGVSLCRTVQEPGQFILVFPRAFTSSICTGYLVSESVYFAQPKWLKTAEAVFRELKESNEPTMFSLERLLFSLAEDSKCNTEVLQLAMPMIKATIEKEEKNREMLRSVGLRCAERLPLPESSKKAKNNPEEDSDYECEKCRANLYLSLVTNSQEEAVYCLPHAISFLNKKKHHLKYSKMLYTYDMEELKELLINVQDKIDSKGSKKK